MAKKNSSSVRGGETARRIWLAGIGAYGRAFSEAQESLAKVTEETSKVFDDLVARGEAIEDTVEEQSRELAAKVAPGNAAIDDRIKRLRSKIGLPEMGTAHIDDDLDDIRSRLDRIEEKLDAILAETTTPVKKSTRKKSATKRKA